MGALPLSKRANTDAKDVKDRLDNLTGKITDAAEKVHSHLMSLLSAPQAYHCTFMTKA